MRKIAWLVLWSLLPGSLWAQTELDAKQRWVEQIDGSFSIPSYAANNNPDPGFGGDINVGYRLDRTLALFAGTGYYQYGVPATQAGTNGQLSYIPLTGIVRASFGDGPIHPYITCGVGIAITAYSQDNSPGSAALKTSRSETDFFLAPGLGFLYAFSSDMAIFLQSRVDLDFTSLNTPDGTRDSPSVFIPLQVGLSFYAL